MTTNLLFAAVFSLSFATSGGAEVTSAPETPPTAAAPPAAAAPPTAEAVLVRLQARYDQVTDLSSTFEQRVVKTGSGLEISRSGSLFLKKPGLMRFDYTSPDPMFYVSDGTTLLQYLPQDQLVYKLGVRGSSLAGPFRFLVGGARIDEELTLSPDGFSDEGARWRLTFSPRADAGAFQSLSLLVDKQSFDVRALIITDPLGNVNHLALGVPAFDPLPREGFDLAIPEGVRVQDLSK